MPDVKAAPYKDDSELEQNFKNLKEHVHDVDFNRWLGARSFGNPTSGTEGALTNSAFWLMVDTGKTTLCAQHYMPTYWNKGKLSVKLFYTGLNSSTNNIIFIATLSGWKESSVSLNSNTGDVSSSETITTPGPATAHFLKTVSMAEANWLSINSDYVYFTLTVTRDGTAGGDTYGNDVEFLGALFTFHPTRR